MPSLYWSSLNVGKVKHTAQFLAGHLERVRNEIQTKTGALVTAILTDNASNMVAAWKILASKLPVFGGGCAAHVLNLVIEEIFKTVTFVSDVQAEAYKIVKLVRSHIGLLEEFKDLQKSMIPRGH
ncbi:hypothetical protein PF005_g15954 [Phytophthora fragariae]|nr:hypothetical protein PR002_g23615 [Phytophthora rubi]KAE8990756.1 hypothetical protein PF011_g18222 [Phytophthora fragariae]KAE9089851.1 hypothetical protein PF007_g19459 [Phytophthora fragariae]KAE9098379.1 hypothetical protein PF010_g15587 [Phytophthora fragariae]KAE9134100.1 hypothetical protein PF006_g14901 [Phytophthora fragariae]